MTVKTSITVPVKIKSAGVSFFKMILVLRAQYHLRKSIIFTKKCFLFTCFQALIVIKRYENENNIKLKHYRNRKFETHSYENISC